MFCVYNNKEEVCNVILKTGDYIITEDGNEDVSQHLILEIGNKKFTFYVNDSKYIDYKKEGKYCFLSICINNDSIYGFEVNEEKYYKLNCIQEYILKHVEHKIAKKFKNNKKQNTNTYLLKNNKKCAFELIVDYNSGITKFTYNLLDASNYFEKYLDITLLKPVREWDD